MCSKEFCDTEDGFVPAYQDGSFILCGPCHQEDLSDHEAQRPWAYYNDDTPSIPNGYYLGFQFEGGS